MIDPFSICRFLSWYSSRLIRPLLRSSSSLSICRLALYSYPPPVPRAPTAAPPQNEGLQPHCTKPATVNSRYNVFFMAHPPRFWLEQFLYRKILLVKLYFQASRLYHFCSIGLVRSQS